jgi:DNA-binding transcriptional MerR regulator
MFSTRGQQRMEEKDLIKISKMAAMHGISRQTLILYDKNGLLKPAYINEAGYRFYSVLQIPYLREICFLKGIGISLTQIRSYLQNRTIASMQDLLEEREQVIEEEIAQLDQQREYLRQRKSLFAHMSTKSRNVNHPAIEWIPERKVVFSPYPTDEMDKSELHLTLMKAWEQLIDHDMLPSSGFGSLIRLGSVRGEKPLEGAGSIVILPFYNDIDDVDLITLPAGEYATMYKYSMPYDTGPARQLLDWMDENGCEPAGDIVDMCLLDAIFYDDKHKEDFCRLEVLVK